MLEEDNSEEIFIIKFADFLLQVLQDSTSREKKKKKTPLTRKSQRLI
jgi:hypothetical protein